MPSMRERSPGLGSEVFLKRIFWTLGAVLCVVGLWGVYDRLAFGHLHANYGNMVPWGLWVSVYIYFIGLSAGAFLISSLVYVFNLKQFQSIGRVAVFTAMVTLLLALLSIVFDLGHIGRAWHVIVYANFSSMMAWMIWLYLFYFLLVVAELWYLLRHDLVVGAKRIGWKAGIYRLLALGSRDTSKEGKARDRKRVKLLATTGIPLAIMFHGGVGALFGVVGARPHWHSGMFPILFLLSALVSGGALLTMVAAVFQDGLNRNRETVVALGKLVLGLFLLDVLFQISEYLIAFRGGIPSETASLKLILTGHYWFVFWGWQVLLGTIAPILILVSRLRSQAPWVAVAGLLIALGLFGMRLNIVIPGLAVEEVAGISNAVSSGRISVSYFPSLSEWLLSVGIVGLGLLLFGLGEMLLPDQSEEDRHVRV